MAHSRPNSPVLPPISPKRSSPPSCRCRQARAKTHAKLLAAVERRTGVPAGILLAIWGKESAFGTAAIKKDAVRTLATQAFMGSRRDEFLPELVAALLISRRNP